MSIVNKFKMVSIIEELERQNLQLIKYKQHKVQVECYISEQDAIELRKRFEVEKNSANKLEEPTDNKECKLVKKKEEEPRLKLALEQLITLSRRFKE